MSYTYTVDVGNGIKTVFPFSFAGQDEGYLSVSNIQVFVAGTSVPFTIYRNDPNKVYLSAPPVVGAEVLIRRIMPKNVPFTDFSRGNPFSQDALNDTNLQQLYVVQELLDGFLPVGFYFKQDVNMGGHKLVNLGEGTQPGDSIRYEQWEDHEQRLDALENDLTGVTSRTIPYYYIATGGEIRWQVSGRTFDSAIMFINGVFQNQSLGAFSISSNGFNFAEPLQKGDEVYALIGSTPATGSMINDQDVEVVQPVAGAVMRTQHAKNFELLSVKDFGAVGDANTDDTAAIQLANDVCALLRCTLWFPRGVYVCTNGIDKTCEWRGEGAAKVGVFPLTDDKVHLVPGYKQNLPGSCLLFKGVGTKSFSTNRTDQLSSMRYCVKSTGRLTEGLSPFGRDLAIVCDFNFRDTPAGAITQPNTDSSADYDVGLLLVNTDLSGPRNVTVGGYFKKAGTVHFGQDPDGCTCYELRTMGDIGLAIIGDGTGTNSAFNMHGGAIFANDHHSRSVDPATEKWGKHAVYIDIPSSASGGSRNGISFHGTWVATKVNVPVKYDRCGAIQWFGVVFENATQAGSAQAGGLKKQEGTADTGDIAFFGCRFNSEQIRGAGNLLTTAPNSTVIIAGSNRQLGLEYWTQGLGLRTTGNASQTNLQFTTADSTTSTSGAVIRRTVDGSLHFLVDNSEKFTMTSDGVINKGATTSSLALNAGAVTVNRNMHRLMGTGDLSTINGGVDGMRVLFVRNTSADVVTLKDGTGNLRIKGDFTLGAFDTIELVYFGTFWWEVSRTDRT